MLGTVVTVFNEPQVHAKNMLEARADKDLINKHLNTSGALSPALPLVIMLLLDFDVQTPYLLADADDALLLALRRERGHVWVPQGPLPGRVRPSVSVEHSRLTHDCSLSA